MNRPTAKTTLFLIVYKRHSLMTSLMWRCPRNKLIQPHLSSLLHLCPRNKLLQPNLSALLNLCPTRLWNWRSIQPSQNSLVGYHEERRLRFEERRFIVAPSGWSKLEIVLTRTLCHVSPPATETVLHEFDALVSMRYSLNTLDDESSVSTGFRSPWKPNRRPRASRSGRLYIGFRGDLNPVDTSIRRLTYIIIDFRCM